MKALKKVKTKEIDFKSIGFNLLAEVVKVMDQMDDEALIKLHKEIIEKRREHNELCYSKRV